MPAITPELLDTIREAVEETLRIYSDGPWRVRVEVERDTVQINVRGQRGYVFYGLGRAELEHNHAAHASLIQWTARHIERQVQEWLRANPPPPAREFRIDFGYTRDGETISAAAAIAALTDHSNKIDSTVNPEVSAAPEPERISSWERILGDFLV